MILALDQGTTSSRSILFGSEGEEIAKGQQEFRQLYPQSGWVEHDPDEIWQSQIATIERALSAVAASGRTIKAVGITNQRETTIVWDRRSGKPIANAMVWQDRRTSAFCDRIRSEFGPLIHQKTGLEVDAYFSASKIRWLLDNVAGAWSSALNGDLAFGTVDAWLVWKLTGGRLHITDVSNASRTMLFNIRTLDWDDELLEIFGVPRSVLPEVRSSSEVYDEIVEPAILRGVPIAGIAGDQQAALLGQACFVPGSVKNTYGTGCFMLQNVGPAPVESQHRLLSTVAWKIGDQVEYALEGSVFIGGAVVQWLRDSLGIIEKSSDIEQLAAAAVDNGGVYFVPAFSGLGTPHWDQAARGMIIGLTRGTGRAHIARAALESIAYQTADLLSAMKSDSDSAIDELRVDGGAAGNDELLAFQADILQIPVVRSKTLETTALGAAYLAGLAVGIWRDRTELAAQWKPGRVFEPRLNASQVRPLIDKWHDAVRRSLNWAE
jgi:glycerol kinase